MAKTVWTFEAGSILVRLTINPIDGYEYDGDDEGGETQRALDEGELIAFDSAVEVLKNGHIIGADYLCGSVYKAGEESEFWTAHRSSDPLNRNCSIMRAARGANVSICHYFPDMVRLAIADARTTLAKAA